jgi:MFS family permease
MAAGIYKRRILAVTVFVCGAVVMIFEIVGSRVLSPFIGTSTYIWTSLIGVILASLSLGYWLGGRLADRRPDVKVLAAFILAAGGLISLTVLLKEILLSFIAATPIPLEIKALVASLLLFAPASICLGVVTPFTTRLVITSVEKTGGTVGRLYALSTVGSILGTFAAGFFLVPFVGSIRTLYFISLVLIVLSACLTPLAASKLNITVIILFFLALRRVRQTPFFSGKAAGYTTSTRNTAASGYFARRIPGHTVRSLHSRPILTLCSPLRISKATT